MTQRMRMRFRKARTGMQPAGLQPGGTQPAAEATAASIPPELRHDSERIQKRT
jgi:hypothetical protein